MLPIKLIAFLLLPLLAIAGHQQQDAAPRETSSFNSDWKFHLGEIEVTIPEDQQNKHSTEPQHPDFNASQWRTLDLPHDWSIEQERKQEHHGLNGFFPNGVVWYRKDFFLPKHDAGKHIEVQFDGVYQNATVWINGYLLGTQYDGYTSFYHDISEMVTPGENNTLAVRVDTSGDPVSRWYSGAGIYRNVWLTKTAQLHVANWGTYITTPEVTSEQATVSIQTEIENFAEAVEFVLETQIIDPSGRTVAQQTTPYRADRMRPLVVEQTLVINQPARWSLETPQLYKAISSILVKGHRVDQYHSTFGIRTIAFDAEKGFFLNGKNLKMKGVCLHHAAGSLGAAVPIEVWERRLTKLKAIGCNAIRTAHNPMSPEFMDLCDQMGFLVMDEFVDKWSEWHQVFNPMFRTEWQKNFRETIRRDRNHPSVIIWSVGNENHPSGDPKQNQGLREYGSFVRKLDPTRPVVSGMERGRDMPIEAKVQDIIESCHYMDLIALNYGEQWCRAIHEAQPNKAYVSTESYRYFNSKPDQRHALIEHSPWIDVLNNDSNMGLYLWVGINYLGEVSNKKNRGWPRNGSNSGLFDVSGMRKEISYLYEAFWSEKPMVYIAAYQDELGDFSGMNNWRVPRLKSQWQADINTPVDLVTYSNCEAVDLHLNDTLIGTQKLVDNPNWILNWENIIYLPGTLKAVGKNHGIAVCEYILKTPEASARLQLEADTQSASMGDVIHVEVSLVDANDTRLVDDTRELIFEIEGGEILALENGNVMFDGSFTNRRTRALHKGTALCILKATDRGELKLTLRAEQLSPATVTITVD